MFTDWLCTVHHLHQHPELKTFCVHHLIISFWKKSLSYHMVKSSNKGLQIVNLNWPLMIQSPAFIYAFGSTNKRPTFSQSFLAPSCPSNLKGLEWFYQTITTHGCIMIRFIWYRYFLRPLLCTGRNYVYKTTVFYSLIFFWEQGLTHPQL